MFLSAGSEKNKRNKKKAFNDAAAGLNRWKRKLNLVYEAALMVDAKCQGEGPMSGRLRQIVPQVST